MYAVTTITYANNVTVMVSISKLVSKSLYFSDYGRRLGSYIKQNQITRNAEFKHLAFKHSSFCKFQFRTKA